MPKADASMDEIAALIEPSFARWSIMAREAAQAHRTFASEVAHPVVVGAAEQDHLKQWLGRRLGRRTPVPDPASLGFRLLGGRILPSGLDVAAQLMFDDARGGRVSFYMRTGESREAALDSLRQGEVIAYYWADDGCGYVVAGTGDVIRLKEAAELVYRQLEETPGRDG
jgi:anti-sigma factor RsiW